MTTNNFFLLTLFVHFRPTVVSVPLFSYFWVHTYSAAPILNAAIKHAQLIDQNSLCSLEDPEMGWEYKTTEDLMTNSSYHRTWNREVRC